MEFQIKAEDLGENLEDEDIIEDSNVNLESIKTEEVKDLHEDSYEVEAKERFMKTKKRWKLWKAFVIKE